MQSIYSKLSIKVKTHQGNVEKLSKIIRILGFENNWISSYKTLQNGPCTI